MLILIIILFLFNAAITSYNSYLFLEYRKAANFGAAVFAALVSLMMIAQYLVSGLR